MKGSAKKWIIVTVVVLAAVAAAYMMFGAPQKAEYVTSQVERGEIIQTVSVTGSIKAEPTIDLHFKKSGEVKSIDAVEGERVEKGQVLATLENRQLDLEIQRNNANLAYARAEYEKLKAGTRQEEIRIAEADVESTRAAYNAALTDQKSMESIGRADVEKAQLAYDKARDDAAAAEKDLATTKALAEKEIANLELGGENVNTVALDNAYVNARIRMASTITAAMDSVLLVQKINGAKGDVIPEIPLVYQDSFYSPLYAQGLKQLEDASELYGSLASDAASAEIEAALDATIKAANTVSSLLVFIGGKLQEILHMNIAIGDWIEKVSTQSSVLTSSIASLNEIINTINNLNTGTAADTETLILSSRLKIDAAENAYNAALNALDTAKFNLDQARIDEQNNNENARAQVAIKQAAMNAAGASLQLKKSPVRQVDLAPLSAQIRLAEVALAMAQNEYEDSSLVAPINGLVTFIYGKVGENVSISETALSSFLTIQADNLIVEANVPETDVSKIKPGDKVEMTIDAFDFTEKFHGSVVYIDPAETVIQGVVYYQIKTAFDLDDDRLKSGMTTNLNIVTAQKQNVLVIPARAVRYEDSTRYVEVLRNGSPEKVYIKTGLENDQEVEVTEGLIEGDKIITFVK